MKTKPWAIVLIILCTICTSLAAPFNKKGAEILTLTIQGTILNPYLIIGMVFLVLAVVLLTASLKGGDVSVVYPIIATSYAWVTLVSYYYFKEQINIFKIAGIAFIILGVIVINLAHKKKLWKKIGVIV